MVSPWLIVGIYLAVALGFTAYYEKKAYDFKKKEMRQVIDNQKHMRNSLEHIENMLRTEQEKQKSPRVQIKSK